MTTIVFLALLGLWLKHFVFDFLYQPPRMYLNKGTYFHPGGIEHAAYHAVGTFAAFVWLIDPIIAFSAAAIDGLIHYHVDWAKMNINKHMGWGPTTHNEFWILLGVDQALHWLTYIWLVWMFV